MSKSKYRILRLRSGEDIIGQITGKSKGKLIVHRPMQMKVSMLFNERTSEKQEVVLFRNWLKETVHTSAKIPEDHVASYLTPSADVVKLYEEEMEKEDCNPPLENNSMKMFQQMQDMMQKKKSPTPQMSDHIEPGSIFVTLAIPPAIFLHMVAQGILGGEEIEDMRELEREMEPTDEELREIEREVEEGPLPTENPDFGNRFEDWPDLPEDYM